jgi:hypothetical protein
LDLSFTYERKHKKASLFLIIYYTIAWHLIIHITKIIFKKTRMMEKTFLPYCNSWLIPTSLLPLIHCVYNVHCSPEVSNLPSNSSYANLATSKQH